MKVPRNLALTVLGSSLIMAITGFSGCGGSTNEVDNAERIEKEAPKPPGTAETKPATDPSTPPDAPKE